MRALVVTPLGPGSTQLASLGQADLSVRLPPPTTFVTVHLTQELVDGAFAGALIARIVQTTAAGSRHRNPPSKPTPGRNAMLTDPIILHRRLGLTSGLLMRALSDAAVGVSCPGADLTKRYISSWYLEAASRRRAITGARLPEAVARDADHPMGTCWSGDTTGRMVRSHDGHHYVFVFLELRSGIIFSHPMPDKTTASSILAFEALDAFVQRTFPAGSRLEWLHLDSDPAWTKTNPNSSLLGTRNVAAIDRWIRDTGRGHLRIKHSPPYTQALNPVENIMARIVFKMNFFLHQGHLALVWWEDMFSAAVVVLNGIPRIHSRDALKRTQSPKEIAYGNEHRRAKRWTALLCSPASHLPAKSQGAAAPVPALVGLQLSPMAHGASRLARAA